MSGISVKFYLESRVKGDPKKLLPIFLYVRHQGNTLKVYTERKCNRHAWDVTKCRANTKKINTAVELNDFLSDLETETSNLFNYNLRKGVLTTKSQVINLIAELSGKELIRINFIKFAEDYLQNVNYAKNTKKGYQTTINLLHEYSSAKRKLIDFNDIDLNFYDSFVSYMWKEKGFNDNTVGKHIKNVKSLMSEAFERGLHSNLDFKKKRFQVFQKEADSIYLSDKELNSLLALKLKNKKRLAEVRDIFYVASWLGLRFSDLVRVSKEKFIKEDGMHLFKIEAQKTGSTIKIPVSPAIIPILEKYNYSFPVITNQELNRHLKTLGEAANINQGTEITNLKAGEKLRSVVPKYDLITTHTARRSFATNLFLQGVPVQSIMAVTGHKTEKAFQSYLRLSDLQRVKELDTHFKKMNFKSKPKTKIK